MIITKYNFSLVYAITSVVFILLGILSKDSLEIAFHDTYIVSSYRQAFMLLSLCFAFYTSVSLVLHFIRRTNNLTLSIIHYLLTVIALFLLYHFINPTSIENVVYQDFDLFANPGIISKKINDTTWIVYSFMGFIVIQTLYFINIIIGLKRKGES